MDLNRLSQDSKEEDEKAGEVRRMYKSFGIEKEWRRNYYYYYRYYYIIITIIIIIIEDRGGDIKIMISDDITTIIITHVFTIK